MDRYIGLDPHASSCTLGVLGSSGARVECGGVGGPTALGGDQCLRISVLLAHRFASPTKAPFLGVS